MRAFSVDLRSLALFRVALGLVIIVDTLFRMTTLNGIYGRHPNFTAAVFVLTILFALGFTLGYRTRVCTIVVWALVATIQKLNPLALYGADDLLLALLFWSMFAPLGDRNQDQENSSIGLGSTGLMLQLLCMYFFAGLMKQDKSWWSEGSALSYVFQLEMFTTPLAQNLLQFPSLLKILTWTTMALEILGPIAVLLSRGYGRLTLIFVFIGFHATHLFTLELGVFPMVSMVAWIVFLPSEVYRISVMQRLAKLANYFPSRGPARANSPPWLDSTRSVLFTMAILTMIGLNITRLFGEAYRPPSAFRQVTRFLGLYQNWQMFAPMPLMEDGWYVFDGELRDGTHINPFLETPVTFEKPNNVPATYRNYIWLAYLNRLRMRKTPDNFVSLARYLCAGDSRLVSVEIHFMNEPTPLVGQTPRPVDQQTLYRRRCP